MYEVMTDGLVSSRHDTRAEAEAEIAKVKEDIRKMIENWLDEISTAEEFVNSLTIRSG